MLREFDKIVSKIGYESRSKAIQDAISKFISEWKWISKEKGIRVGVIIMVYDHRKPGLAQKLLSIQHEFEGIINSTFHIHLDEENCMEVIAVKGDSEKIRSLSEILETRKGVKQLKVVIVT